MAQPAPVAQPAPAQPPPAEQQPPPAEEDKPEPVEDPMGSPSLGLRLGFIHFGDAGSSGLFATVPGRTNFKMALPFNFGGKGVGFDLHPAIAFGDVTTVSLYLGLSIEIQLIRQLYLGFGFGLEPGYWLEDAVDVGIDIYGRIPIRVHYYLLDQLGLFGEFGIGYGASGMARIGGDINFGTTVPIDFTVGVRFP